MTGSTSSLFAALARLALIVTLVAAPWPFGGFPLTWQPPLFAGILAALVLWWISVVTRPTSHPEGGTILVDSLLPPLLLILLAAFQLIPFANVPEVPAHAVLHEAAAAEIEANTIAAPMPISVAPSLTRVMAARLVFAIGAAFLGIQLFRDAGTRLWLYVPLALNAAAIAAFGIWQNSQWEDWDKMLFGSVPIREGGQPFGPYVNRNNAAGLLNLGAAAAAAWAFLAAAPRMGRAFRRAVDDAPGSHRNRTATEPRPGIILPVVLLVVVCAGVAASLSRGGIVALAAAVVASLLVLLQSRRSRMAVSVVLVVLPLIALAIGWFGFGKEIRKRFAVLNSHTYQDGRWQHWSETWGAVQDAPLLGQGLGAYRYIHRPYQQSESERWFMNADNQFFELLVENGAIGLALVLGMIALLFVDVQRLLESRAPWEQRDAALLGAILLASQSAQGLTDFGILLPANMLTAATLAGVVAGTAARSLPFQLVPNLSSPMVFLPRTAMVMGLALMATAGMAWREVTLASAAAVATDSIGPLDSPDAVFPPALDAVVAQLQAAADKRPDDAELQRTLGNLLTFRFRSRVFEALKQDPATANRPDAELWARTGLETLFSEAVKVQDEASKQRFRELLQRIDDSDSLTSAKVAYESALAGCRWVAVAAQRDALTQTIVDQDFNSARRSVALAAAGTPGDSARLVILGLMARELGANDLAVASWRQATKISPRRLSTVIAAGGGWLTAEDRLRDVLPDDVEELLSFAESPAGMDFALPVSRRVEELLQETGGTAAHPGEMGRVMQVRGEHAAALTLFEKAARENPLAWIWRIRAANAKADLGRVDEAIRDLQAAWKEFPRQSAFQREFNKLRQKAVTGER